MLDRDALTARSGRLGPLGVLWALADLAAAWVMLTDAFVSKTAAKEGILAHIALSLGGGHRGALHRSDLAMRPDAAHMTPLALVRVLLAASALVLLAAHVTVAAGAIRQLTVTTAADLRPAWSPDAKRIAFQRSENDGQYHIYIIDADGGNARRVTSGDFDDRHQSWSPDGKLLAVDSGTAALREIWVINVATTQRTQVTKLGGNASFPSFSPDGKRLAFFLYQAGTSDLWIAGREGSGAQPVTQGLASEKNQQCTFACHAAAWSPRGDRIAYSSGDHHRVLVMAPVPGAAPTAVSPDGEHSHFPTYLADGRLVYVSEHVTQEQSWTDLWALPPGDNAARTELVGGVQAQGPFDLSPDGRQLLFASPRSGNFEIYSVVLDDAGKAALAERVVRGTGGERATVAPADAAQAARRDGPGPLGESTPYLVALGVVALVGVGVELLVRARRTRR